VEVEEGASTDDPVGIRITKMTEVQSYSKRSFISIALPKLLREAVDSTSAHWLLLVTERVKSVLALEKPVRWLVPSRKAATTLALKW
jgi:hypothetical protein